MPVTPYTAYVHIWLKKRKHTGHACMYTCMDTKERKQKKLSVSGDRQTDRQTDRQKDRQTYLSRIMCQHSLLEGPKCLEQTADGSSRAKLHEDVKAVLHHLCADVRYNVSACTCVCVCMCVCVLKLCSIICLPTYATVCLCMYVCI